MASSGDRPAKDAEESKEGWAAFERAVDAAVKSGPKHRVMPKAKGRPASKGRVHKGKTRA
jgi:hypothetical protein